MTKQIKSIKINPDNLEIMTSFGLEQKQVALINSPTPEQWVKRRKGRGGKEFDYIPVGITIKVLNSVFGFGWSFEITKEQIIDNIKQVLVKGRLTVNIKDKTIVKEQFASKEIQIYSDRPDSDGKINPRAGEYISIGDDLKGASSLCLTKCASMLGLFSDIYSSEFYAKWEMPDGEETIEIKLDNSKSFEVLIEKISKLANKKEMAEKILSTPPFELNDEMKLKLKELVGNQPTEAPVNPKIAPVSVETSEKAKLAVSQN